MLIRADARAIPLADASVDCVVTSPPYWGARDYQDDKQIGLEETPEAFVAAIVAVFREVRRVLKPDGNCWLNLGDCYANDGKWGGETGGKQAYLPDADRCRVGREKRITGLKPKDLVGIPWRVAFALQADGWWLRADNIWAKPNPKPEPVRDRTTRSHEYLFHLTKSESYYYDQAAIFEPFAEVTLRDRRQDHGMYSGLGLKDYGGAGAENPSNMKRRIAAGIQKKLERKNNRSGDRLLAGVNEWDDPDRELNAGRNKRSVWFISPRPFAGPHFAAMPPALVEPCVLAGSRVGGLVFDPFLGSGTVGEVAARLGRRWVGTDLNYHDISSARTAQRGLRFA